METSDDSVARARAVDPRFNVALEASAGTGKTRVLVDRYINLLRAGVDPSNVLAITFTRKAAAEMRERIMATLRAAAATGEIPTSRWRELRDRTADIAISTIDAFCLSLLREFPLEADLDPAFSIADDTELPRLVDEALDRTLRACRSVARDDRNVALAFAQLGERRVRSGLTTLLNRRIVAPVVLSTYLAESGATDLDIDTVTRRAATSLIATLDSMRGGADRFLETGPLEPTFQLLARGLRQLRASLEAGEPLDAGTVQAVCSRAREHFLTQEGEPRARCPYSKGAFASEADWRVHKDLLVSHADAFLRASTTHRRDLNVLVSRGVWRMFRIAEGEYRRTLDAHAVLDFSDVLLRALDLLRRMDDFAQSRYRLESRYHHVLVDEFQDTSRAQWELISLLVQSWGEGAGLAHTGPLQPSIFIVGDRKQSIYGFRDADASVLREASRYLEGLRPDRDVRRSISRSFRAAAPILAFINDVCDDMAKAAARPDAFEYGASDRFLVDRAAEPDSELPLGIVVDDTPEGCAEATAEEIERLLATGVTVRDRETGVRRAIRPADIGILFRTRESHREFEAGLERRDIRSYVYKGLGFFDADEIKDVLALIWFLADPVSDLRAAALLRSRFFIISDQALRLLAPDVSGAVLAPTCPDVWPHLDPEDQQSLGEARQSVQRWLELVDRLPAAELIDVILSESAYALELRGPRFRQARENLKKMRSLMRRIQNGGYGTLARMAAHLNRLAVGDEANAAIDAFDAVHLMTVHAAKGLEFPVVFIVNLARGSGNRRDAVRVTAGPSGGSVAIGDFQSEADDDRVARDCEETKRLLYVALTRARDRLYLGTVLKDGVIQPARGSLGEVLPLSLRECFSTVTQLTEWMSAAGSIHPIRICRVSSSGDHDLHPRQGTTLSPERPADDFAPLVADVSAFRTAALAARDSPTASGLNDPSGHESDRAVGTVVHRMLERLGFDAGPDQTTRHHVLALIRPDEALTEAVGATVDLCDQALAAYRAICARPEMRTVYMSAERWHEVPFSMRLGDSMWRGTIDCVVRTSADTLTVLEFKTGRRRPEHEAQLDLYRAAVARLFPGMRVQTQLVYPNDAVPV